MGEAKAQGKRNRLARLQAEQGCCIYCGGETPGDTVDHVPAIAFFDNRHRPQGLEFLACGPCNSGARRDEQVAAMMSRMLPNPTTAGQREDTRRAINAVGNNIPGLLRELLPSRRQERQAARELPGHPVHALNASGPILTEAMHRFAAKIGLALHRHTTGRTVPREGAVLVRWHSNYQVVTGRYEAEVYDFLGPPQTLRQGSFDAADQFSFSSLAASDDPTLSAHLATFRRSFALVAFVSEDGSRMDEAPPLHVRRPGFLREAPAEVTVMRTPILRGSLRRPR